MSLFKIPKAALKFSVISSLAAGLILMVNPALAKAYDQTYLISDQQFTNSSSMGTGDIQAFLNAKNSGLKNLTDTENCSTIKNPYSFNYYPHCGQSVSAATIIYDAGQAYGVNPMAIIATLQKEQSLITTPNPTSSQINFAMGYGCPDSGVCSFSGFFNQVDNGTWQFRTDIELSSGRNWWGYTPSSYPCNSATRYYSAALKAGNNVTFYDDDGTAYTSFTIGNASTAALYCYTPHAYNNPGGINGLPKFGSIGQYYTGSYNFVSSYSQWFGNPTTGMMTISHRDGTLVKPANSNKIYLLSNVGNWPNENIQARYVPSAAVFASWGFNFKDVEIANQGDLNLMASADANPTGNQVPLQIREGTLVKGSGPDIYVIQNSTSNVKDRIASWDAFVHMGYSLNNVITVPDNDLAAIPTDANSDVTAAKTTHPTGALIKDTTASTVYVVGNGNKQPISSPTVFSSYGYQWSDIATALPGDDSLPTASSLNTFRAGTLVKGSGPNVYIVNTWPDFSAGKLLFNYYTFVGFDYHFSNVIAVPDSEINSLPDGGSVPTY